MPLVYRENVQVAEPVGTVLLLHGYPESSYMWRDLLDPLADAGWCAVAPDLPGYGDSPYAGSGTWEAHVEALDAFHREQELGEVVLCVHDWGGLIGLRWACEHPELVRGLVVSDTGFFPDGRWHEMAAIMRTPGKGEELIDAIDRERFGAMLRAVSTGVDERSLDEYYKTWSSPERRRGQLELYRSGDFEKVEAYDLGVLDVPALVLWGADDPFAPVGAAHRFGRELPQAQVEVLEGVGHFCFDDAPAACAAAVVRFLEGV